MLGSNQFLDVRWGQNSQKCAPQKPFNLGTSIGTILKRSDIRQTPPRKQTSAKVKVLDILPAGRDRPTHALFSTTQKLKIYQNAKVGTWQFLLPQDTRVLEHLKSSRSASTTCRRAFETSVGCTDFWISGQFPKPIKFTMKKKYIYMHPLSPSIALYQTNEWPNFWATQTANDVGGRFLT